MSVKHVVVALPLLTACHLVFPYSPSDPDAPRPHDGVPVLERPRTVDAVVHHDRARDLPGDRQRDLGCINTAECDDGNPCTIDSCINGKCMHAAASLACDDGDPCTTNDSCSGGTCAGTPKCTAASQTCKNGSCVCVSGAILCGGVCRAGWACCPGDKQSCPACGTASCTSTGVWGGCSGQKDCNPGDLCECQESPCTTGVCAGCTYKQKKVCNPTCTWGGCFG